MIKSVIYTEKGGTLLMKKMKRLKRMASVVLVIALTLSLTPAVALALTYTVRAGDCLSAIAPIYGLTWRELYKLNPTIKNPNLIYPGQEINVGGAPVVQVTQTEQTKAKSDSPPAAVIGRADNAAIKARASTGTYIGHDYKGIAEFLGIAYAAPVGKWKAPAAPKTTADDVIVCDEWGPSCIQVPDEVEIASSWKLDYDCLNLNIWTKNPATSGKPVLVFIHGGGGWQGGSYDPLYHGGNFIRNLPEGEDAVMVTINYRLGIFGSLDMSALEGYTDEYVNAINLALLDHIQALTWVRENIGAFGGDAGNVTLMGQSYGAGSVCTLLSIPEANKLFKNAILESGNIFNRQTSMEKAGENAKAVYEVLGVKSVSELLGLSNDELYAKYEDITGAIGQPQRVADGRLIPLDGYRLIKEGSAAGINIMIGTTNGEYDFVASDWDNYPNPVTDPDKVIARIRRSYNMYKGAATCWNPLVDQGVVDEYLAAGADPVLRAADLYNDTHYRQTAIYIAEALSESGSDVYMYHWKWAPDMNAVLEYMGDAAEVSPWGRAMHCAEQIFVFDVPDDGYPELGGPAEGIPKDLIKSTQATWYAFAKYGRPDNNLIPAWKKYNANTRETMIIGEDGSWKLERDPRSADRLILNKIRP